MAHHNNIRLAKSIALLFLLVHTLVNHAQNNNVWIFGTNTGIDFNSGTAVPIDPAPVFSTLEGCSSLCDGMGNLMMYTDGRRVYNREYEVMPNGNNLMDVMLTSTTQATIIVPMPGVENRYYIFSLHPNDRAQGALKYNIVDMTLDSGRGDVISPPGGTLLDTGFTEKMACMANDCSTWLLVRTRDGIFKSYKIMESGIDVPVMSAVGGAPDDAYRLGTLKFSHNGRKVAAALLAFPEDNKTGLELFDFNPETGMITNPVMLDYLETDTSLIANGYYSVCFSPDNTKLYAGKQSYIYQYDISLPAISEVVASKTEIYRAGGNTYKVGDMKVGPDSRIYVAAMNWDDESMHVIETPDAPGLLCNFVENGVDMTTSETFAIVSYGLPNNVEVSHDLEYISTTTEVEACAPVIISATGISGPAGYSWSTGDTTAEISVDTSGIFWVSYAASCTVYTDTFKVAYFPLVKPDLGVDTAFCSELPFAYCLSVASQQGTEVVWSNGATGNRIAVNEYGTYQVTVSFADCVVADTVVIAPLLCDCQLLVPSAFSPNGDGINDVFLPLLTNNCRNAEQYTLRIYNRWGQPVYSGCGADAGWDGNVNRQAADMGVYYYELISYAQKNIYTIYKKGTLTLIR